MLLDEFSAGYWIAPSLEAIKYNGDRAVVQDEVFYQLAAESGLDPLIASVGGRHFEIHPDRQVPCDYLAIPSDAGSAVHLGDAVLISKRNEKGIFYDE